MLKIQCTPSVAPWCYWPGHTASLMCKDASYARLFPCHNDTREHKNLIAYLSRLHNQVASYTLYCRRTLYSTIMQLQFLAQKYNVGIFVVNKYMVPYKPYSQHSCECNLWSITVTIMVFVYKPHFKWGVCKQRTGLLD